MLFCGFFSIPLKEQTKIYPRNNIYTPQENSVEEHHTNTYTSYQLTIATSDNKQALI